MSFEYIKAKDSPVGNACFTVGVGNLEYAMGFIYKSVLVFGGLLLALTGCGAGNTNLNVGASYLPFENNAEITVALNVHN